MKYTVYYDRESRSWWGYWTTPEGDQVGEAVYAHHRDDCLIELGACRPVLTTLKKGYTK
jgi:hypothetical protein